MLNRVQSQHSLQDVILACLIAALICLCGAPSASSETWKLRAQAPLDDQVLGAAVDVHGDYVIAGAWAAGAQTNGAAYVWQFINNGWSQVARLSPADLGGFAQFGRSVAIDGLYAVVGAPGHAERGAAYVYVLADGEWTLRTKLMAGDGVANERFGESVDIHGSSVIVGSQTAMVDGELLRGKAYVYELTTEDQWTEAAILRAADGAPGDNFGFSVALDKGRAVVGAFNQNNGTGAAYVFGRVNAVWQPHTKLTPSDLEPGDGFGNSVDIKADRLVVGALNACGQEAGSGVVYVFRFSDGNWQREARLFAADGIGGELFSGDVAIDGELLLVGALGSRIGENYYQGAAYLYRWANDSWSESQKLVAEDGEDAEEFGVSVALDGEFSVCGAQMERNQDVVGGAVYINTVDRLVVGVKDRGMQLSKSVRNVKVQPTPLKQIGELTFTLPSSSVVKVSVYNAAGAEVQSVFAGQLEAGVQVLPLVTVDSAGQLLMHGVYFLRVEVGSEVYNHKLHVIR